VWLSINSSAPGKQGNYPPEEANELTKEKGAAPTEVLLDPDGTVGRAYGAKTTPHMYVIDPAGIDEPAGGIDSVPSASADDIRGGNGADLLAGNGGADLLNGGSGNDVLADYLQVWRRIAPRFSDTWVEHEGTPLRPRAAEALGLFNNPVRRAPIDRSARAALRARAYAASHGRRLAY
jgi:hypothetical protein